MVRSLRRYCSPWWDPAMISDIQELESEQKGFTARISGMKDIHNWDRLQQLSLMPLQRRRQRCIIIYMWKVLHGATTNNLNIQFVSRPRFGNQAKIPMIRRSASAANSTIHERSFAEMSPTLWNTMPNHLNVMSNFEHYKSHAICSRKATHQGLYQS